MTNIKKATTKLSRILTSIVGKIYIGLVVSCVLFLLVYKIEQLDTALSAALTFVLSTVCSLFFPNPLSFPQAWRGERGMKKWVHLFIAIAIFICFVFLVVPAPDGEGGSGGAKETPAPSPSPTPSASSTPTPDVGSIITFGSFPQNSEEREPIRWLVLTVDCNSNRALVMSVDGLEYMAFDSDGQDYWGKSSLHDYLNGGFLDAAFSEEEQEGLPIIINTTPQITEISNGSHERTTIVDSHSSSKDSVFCLSIDEVEEYLAEGSELYKYRICKPTSYATANISEGRRSYVEGDHWWLRNSCQYAYSVVTVRGKSDSTRGEAGTINERGSNSSGSGILVRPAMWLPFDKISSIEEYN